MHPRSPITVARIQFHVPHGQYFAFLVVACQRYCRNHIPPEIGIHIFYPCFGNSLRKLLCFCFQNVPNGTGMFHNFARRRKAPCRNPVAVVQRNGYAHGFHFLAFKCHWYAENITAPFRVNVCRHGEAPVRSHTPFPLIVRRHLPAYFVAGFYYNRESFLFPCRVGTFHFQHQHRQRRCLSVVHCERAKRFQFYVRGNMR